MKKGLSVVFALLLLVALFAVPIGAAPASTKQTKRAIAVVFDNSGSMYLPGDGAGGDEFRYAWCRATYAMEAFATMMNEGDVMQIYPMHAIKVEGKTYTSSKPLSVTQKNATVIEKIHTPVAKTTPIETITHAYNGLTKVKADEKWLIVLTDGDVFYRGNENLKDGSLKALKTELSKCVKKVNVAYLGIGTQAIKPEGIQGKNQYIADKADSSTQVLEKLTSMCNTIFGRDTLPNVKDKIRFDVSMNKLIVFIQGEGISNVKLEGHDPTTENSLKYGNLGCGKTLISDNKEWKEDTSLQGKLLTYENVPKGEYTLSFSGKATSVVCYYEPNVQVSLKLLDKEGVAVDPNGKLTEGAYSIQYALTDGITNEPTTSSLLGKTQYTFTVNGEKHTATQAGKIGPLTMKANEKLNVDFTVTYLDGYTLSGNASDLGWPSGGIVFKESIGELKATLSGGEETYPLSKLEAGSAFRIRFTYNGKECSDKVLNSLKKNLTVSFDKPINYTVTQDGQDFVIALKYAEDNPLETATGRIQMTVTSQYINENGDGTNPAGVNGKFSVKDDSRTLDMSVVRGQSYYQISELENSDPITIKLNYDGDPLTEEELKAVKIGYEPSHLKLILEPDYKNSKILVRFDPKNPPESDDYDIEFTATGKNEIGKPQSVTKKTAVEVGTLPLWLKILLPILILLLLLLLIWWWLRQPRLPKRIDMTNIQYLCDGEIIPTTGLHTRYTGGGKKSGELRVCSPKCPTDPMAQQGVILTLKAITPRRVKSRQRKASIQSFRALNAAQVLDLRIKATSFMQDPEKPGRLVLTTNGQPMTKPMEIGHNTPIAIVSDTGETNASFNCTLTFN